MVKKKALGDDPLSWIKSTVEPNKENQDVEKQLGSHEDDLPFNKPIDKAKKSDIPKFQTYEIQLAVRFRNDQLEFLSKLEREIMQNRSSINRKERITKNSILRAITDALMDIKISLDEIRDESELLNRFKQAINLSRHSKS